MGQASKTLSGEASESLVKAESVIQNKNSQLPLFNVKFSKNNQGIYTFSNPIPRVHQYVTRPVIYNGNKRLVAVDPDGELLPVLEGEFYFAYPRVLTDSTGRIHMLWSEPDSARFKDRDEKYTSIYHTSYKNGRWSDPHIIYEAESLEWEPPLTSNFFVDEKGTFHILFTSDETDSTGTYTGFVHLYKDESGWDRNFWNGKRAWGCGYLDLAIDKGQTLYMTCIGPDYDTPNDRNSVFFSYSEDYGENWAEPVLVSRSGQKEAHFSRILIDNEKNLHLLWSKSLDPGFLTETIWHAISTDGGTTWSEPIDLELDFPVLEYRVVSDTENRFHLLYSTMDEENQTYRTYYKMWNGHKWLPEETPLFPEDNIAIASELLVTKD